MWHTTTPTEFRSIPGHIAMAIATYTYYNDGSTRRVRPIKAKLWQRFFNHMHRSSPLSHSQSQSVTHLPSRLFNHSFIHAVIHSISGFNLPLKIYGRAER